MESEGFTHGKLIVNGEPRMCSDVTFSLTQYSTTLHKCTNVNTCPIPVDPWVVQYMLNDVLCNLRGIHKEVFHLCTAPMCLGKWGAIRMLHRRWVRVEVQGGSQD